MLGGWQRMEWWTKDRVQNRGRAQKPAWKGYAGSLMADMKQNQHRERLDY